MNRGLRLAWIVLLAAACQSSEQRATSDSAHFELAPSVRAVERPPRALVKPCLAYDDTIVVRGRLRREVYPGPPNYESIKEGDVAEVGFYLTLEHPICARAPYPDPDDASLVGKDDVMHIQLVLDQAGYRRLQAELGRIVELRGSLFAGHTGHHHAPVLLRVIEHVTAARPRKPAV